MPRLGLPVEYLPEGLDACEYLKMGARYEQFGYAEQARLALKEAIKVAPQANEAKRAKLRLCTRIPAREVKDDATRRYVDALKLFVTQELDESKQTLELLIRIIMMEGQIDRARDLAAKVLKLNQQMLKAHLLIATIDLIEWKIVAMDQRLKRIEELDSDSAELATFRELLLLIDQQGLR
jgi:tetratricopeptide (TPR) repeat protein